MPVPTMHSRALHGQSAGEAAATQTPLRFNAQELAGSLGDLGTFLPLAVGLTVVCGMDLGLILIFAGLMHIFSGWRFRQPMPVQPMKAIAAVAITEGLMPGEIAAAGLLMGLFVLALALSGTVDAIVQRVPKSVVRGIQAGVGLKLALKGVAWLTGVDLVQWQWNEALPLLGFDSLVVAFMAFALIAWPRLRRWPILLIVFVAGLGLAGVGHPTMLETLHLNWPQFQVVVPEAQAWWAGLWRGALPQLPLTLLNSVVAVCALSADLYPGRGVAPRRVATSVGLMNLLAVPFGGMPMCHGSGGLAAQHRFGARTGGSVIMLGIMKVAAGLLLGVGFLPLLQAYPRSILAVMLLFAGVTLARPARDSLRSLPLNIVVVTVAGILLGNTAIGTVCGFAMLGVMHLLSRIRQHDDPKQP